MPNLTELKFAQKFPFTSSAKTILRQTKANFDAIDSSVLERAFYLIESASYNPKEFIEKEFSHQISEYEDILVQEVIAFPVAKILISFQNNPVLNERFASMVAKRAGGFISGDKESLKTLLDLANDLGVQYDIQKSESEFVLPLQSFLSTSSHAPELKLVNQNLENGKIFLTRNQFTNFIQAKIFSTIYDSLPVDLASVPPIFGQYNEKLSERLKAKAKLYASEFKFGKINPELFPPCMEKMYSELLQGKNLGHIARFDIACFMSAIGMPGEQIIQLYSKTPNWNEKTTRYHVESITGKKSGKKYSAPSCIKVKEHGLCVASCPVYSPLQFYRKGILQSEKQIPPAAPQKQN